MNEAGLADDLLIITITAKCPPKAEIDPVNFLHSPHPCGSKTVDRVNGSLSTRPFQIHQQQRHRCRRHALDPGGLADGFGFDVVEFFG